MSNSFSLLILAGGLYFFSLLIVFLIRVGWKKYRKRFFAIPYDRLPIGLALILLVAVAGVLASGNEVMANDIAIMAYYLLVFGVLLLFINYIREQRKLKRTPNSKNAVNYPNSEDAANHSKREPSTSEPPNG